jgi:hypothetical protein
MKAKQVTYLLAGALTLVGVGSTVQAAWIDPSGGWQVDYKASSGKLPNDVTTSPKWNMAYYQTTNSSAQAYTAIQNDSVTGEKAVFLGNDGTTSSGAARNDVSNYNLGSGAGAGTTTDKITMDFRFRLLDDSQPDDKAQLQFIVLRPTGTTGQRQLYLLNFAEDGVSYLDASSTYSHTAASIGTGWHDARWLIDVATQTSRLYLDGSATPLFDFSGYIQPYAGNLIQFGKGSGLVLGEANVSYVRFTNNELAAVPEPASLGLLALGGSAILLKRRRRA